MVPVESGRGALLGKDGDVLGAVEGAPERRRGTRGRLAVGAGLAGATALTTTALLLGGAVGGPAAYASWTPVPQGATPAQALEQAEACAQSWGELPAGGITAADVLLAERRGDSALTLVRKDGDVASCLSLDPTTPTGWELISGVEPGGAPQGRVVLVGSGASEGPQGWVSQVVGVTGPGVTAVDVIAADGTKVEATVSGGFWVAWWPGEDAGTGEDLHVDVHTATGATAFSSSELRPVL